MEALLTVVDPKFFSYFWWIRCFLLQIHSDLWNPNQKIQNCVSSTYPSFAFPIDEKSIFVHFECARNFEICIIFLFGPSIEYTADQQWFGHRYLPIEFKLLRHSSRLFMISTPFHQIELRMIGFRSFLLFRNESDRFRTKCNSSEIRKKENGK